MANEQAEYESIPLRPVDRMYGFSHDAKLQPNISTTASYEAVDGQKLTPLIVFAALHMVIKQHPRLAVTQVRSVTKGGRHQRLAVRLNKVYLQKCVDFVNNPNTELRDVLEAEKNQWFDIAPLAPQWRLVVLNGKEVVFLFNHLACDGMSTLAFHKSLISSINYVSAPGFFSEDASSDEFAVVSVPDVPPVESPIAAFERDTARIWMLSSVAREVLRTAAVKVIFFGRNHIFHDAKHSRYRTRTGAEVTKAQEKDGCAPQYISLSVPGTTMKRLMLLCKANGATFTALLHTVILGVLSSYIYPEAVYARSRLAVSYRRFTGTPDDTMTDEAGNIYWGRRLKELRKVFAEAEEAGVMHSVIWREAKQYRDHIHNDLSDEAKHSRTNGYSKFMGAYDDQLARTIGIVGSQRHNTIEISNLGVFDPAEKRDANASEKSDELWKITDVSFNGAPSHRCFGCAVTFGVISLKGGDCRISMGYDGKAIKGESMRLFSEKLSLKLMELSLGDGEKFNLGEAKPYVL